MIENKIRQLWADGHPVLNGWLGISNPFTAEIMAQQGYDALTIDMQHGAIGYDGAFPMLQAMRASGTPTMVRVPWLDPADIMKALDAGAYGIVCPMVNSRAEAERLVSYVRYPPQGTRSYGPIRAVFSAGKDYAEHANKEIVCLAMIETAEAYENLDEILCTAGLDGIYIGPADLTLSIFGEQFGPGFDRREPEILQIIKDIARRAHLSGMRAGLHTASPQYASDAIDWGFDLVTVSTDVRLLVEGVQNSINKFRELRDPAFRSGAVTGSSY
jgi:4-hydroxy-2-oxoheptanedioate aldolase